MTHRGRADKKGLVEGRVRKEGGRMGGISSGEGKKGRRRKEEKEEVGVEEKGSYKGKSACRLLSLTSTHLFCREGKRGDMKIKSVDAARAELNARRREGIRIGRSD